jgi:hypothetical protein
MNDIFSSLIVSKIDKSDDNLIWRGAFEYCQWIIYANLHVFESREK